MLLYSIIQFEWWKLGIAFIPVLFALIIICRWTNVCFNTWLALARMVIQLSLVGFILTWLFKQDVPLIFIMALSVMLFVAAWIGLRTVPSKRRRLYVYALASMFIGGLVALTVATQLVLEVKPWYNPRYLIPLGGMVFSNALNAVSLSAERFFTELESGKPLVKARGVALATGLIPITNALLAVGIVSVPGVMTGQILAGQSPFIAVKYQILIMLMVFTSASLSTIGFLSFLQGNRLMKLIDKKPV